MYTISDGYVHGIRAIGLVDFGHISIWAEKYSERVFSHSQSLHDFMTCSISVTLFVVIRTALDILAGSDSPR